MTWSAKQYVTFEDERTRPVRDLLSAVPPIEARSAIDLGCGPGNSTAVLAGVFPEAELLGLDSSPDMIAAARREERGSELGGGPLAEWVVADAAAWDPRRSFDLVFSNAALQWIRDQASLLRRMWGWLAPGGLVAVQVPGNKDSCLHRALRGTADGPAWKARFAGMDESIRYHEPDFYYEILAPLGGAVEVWESTYWHVLANQAALIDWYSGTGMRPWLERLDDDAERRAFKDEVLEAAKPGYPIRGDGSVFFPFRRIFFTAKKPS